MPKVSQAHVVEMRQRILDGAQRAFAERGFRGTSVPEIAAEADVSVGLIYRYFESKAELFLSMCEGETEARLELLGEQLARVDDPQERLELAIRHYVESIPEGWGPLLTNGWAEADLDPRLRAALQRRSDRLRAFSASFLRDAIARGEALPDLDPEALGLAAAMLLDGAIAHHAERGEEFDAEAVIRAITALLALPLRPPY